MYAVTRRAYSTPLGVQGDDLVVAKDGVEVLNIPCSDRAFFRWVYANIGFRKWFWTGSPYGSDILAAHERFQRETRA